MYGSSFCIVTRSPRVFSKRPNDDAVMPFPSEEATPPVTNTCFVTGHHHIARRHRSPGCLVACSLSAGAPPRAVLRRGHELSNCQEILTACVTVRRRGLCRRGWPPSRSSSLEPSTWSRRPAYRHAPRPAEGG